MRRNYCLHFALGLGLREVDTLQFSRGDAQYWFHFGGSAYETLITSLLPSLTSVRGLKGFALRGRVKQTELVAVAHDVERARGAAVNMEQQLAGFFSPGPYHKLLPDDVRIGTTVALLGPEEFCRWLTSRNIHLVETGHPVHPILVAMVEDALAK